MQTCLCQDRPGRLLTNVTWGSFSSVCLPVFQGKLFREEMCWRCEADGQSPDVGKLDRSSGLYGGESLLLGEAAQFLLVGRGAETESKDGDVRFIKVAFTNLGAPNVTRFWELGGE